MRNILFSFAMAGALVMGGCASIFPQQGPGYVSEIDTPQEVLATAELTFQGALSVASVLDAQGLLTATDAAKLQAVFVSAYSKLVTARQLVDAGSQATAALKDLDTAIAALVALTAQLKQVAVQ